jgi:protein involved in polysaccharide export with SLBB domain
MNRTGNQSNGGMLFRLVGAVIGLRLARQAVTFASLLALVQTLAFVIVFAKAAHGAEVAPILRAGDEITVTLADPDPRMLQLSLDEKGEVTIGVYGAVPLAGLTEAQAETQLRQRLSRYLRGTDAVTLRMSRNKRLVLVSGRVKKPGLVRVEPTQDLWQAVQLAGGPDAGADLTRVALFRNGKEQPVDLRAFLTREGPAALPTLEPGDTVFVPADAAMPAAESGATALLSDAALARKVFVVGGVTRPGLYDRTPGMTPWTAIALAGGPQNDAELANVRIVTRASARRVDVSDGAAGLGQKLPTTTEAVIVYVPTTGGSAEGYGQFVNVIGGVSRPGRIRITGRVTLIDVLAIAGGDSKEGDLGEVRLVRQSGRYSLAVRFDVNDYLKEGGALGRFEIEPNDTLYVGRNLLEPGRTALQVISSMSVIAAAVAVFARL